MLKYICLGVVMLSLAICAFHVSSRSYGLATWWAGITLTQLLFLVKHYD